LNSRKLLTLLCLLLISVTLAACGDSATNVTPSPITAINTTAPNATSVGIASVAPSIASTSVATVAATKTVLTPTGVLTPVAELPTVALPTTGPTNTPTADQKLLSDAVKNTAALTSYHLLLVNFNRGDPASPAVTTTLEGDVDVTNKKASYASSSDGKPGPSYYQSDQQAYEQPAGGKWAKAQSGPGFSVLGSAFSAIEVGPGTEVKNLGSSKLDGTDYKHLQSLTIVKGGITVTADYLIGSNNLLKQVTAIGAQTQQTITRESGFTITLSKQNEALKIADLELPPTPAKVAYPNGAEPTAAPVLTPTTKPQPGPVLIDVDKGIATKEMKIYTTKGLITLDLYPNAAPATVKNYEERANRGEYNGRTFHRVEAWVVQGNDPLGTGSGGGDITTEINKISYTVGSLGVARAALDYSNDSQFFITKASTGQEADLKFLNAQIGADNKPTGGYTLFGQVTSGQDVVNSIEIGDKIYTVQVTDKK